MTLHHFGHVITVIIQEATDHCPGRLSGCSITFWLIFKLTLTSYTLCVPLITTVDIRDADEDRVF
jgi:hypothetical protein